jgi:serine/threonine-protein kinase
MPRSTNNSRTTADPGPEVTGRRSTRRKRGSFENIAAAIADGSSVDWRQILGLTTGAQRSLLEHLHLIADVANLYRARQADADDPQRPEAALDERPLAVEPGPALRRTWGGLALIEEIGRGSFGRVYRAHDPHLDRPVAVKLLFHRLSRHDSPASRLLREGRVLAQVSHPNVVKVYAAEEHNGQAGLVMEFVRGLTLDQMLVNHGPFSAVEAGVIGRELCRALAAVHHAGLIHRDVKAQNVVREQGGRLVLMDFGSGQKQPARRRGGQPRRERIRIRGTPLYLAPEVLMGADASVASDIYALGVLLFHLVTSEFPVKARGLDALQKAHAQGNVLRLLDLRPDLPTKFVSVINRAIHHDPAKRFNGAGQMETALARFVASAAQASVVPRLQSPKAPPRRRRASSSVTDAAMASIAVLPFSDMSPAKDQESFCDGITEELINGLTQIAALRVAARTSSFQFKGRASDIRQIGEALNVGAVLDGSVRRDSDRLRVTVELTSTADGFQLWSHRFDGSLENVFAVQDEIAASVVETLRGKLLKEHPVYTPRSRDLQAYRYYLEGRYYWNKRTEGDLDRSVDFFRQAIARDPGYAKAHAALADAYVTLATYGAVAASDVMPQANRAVEQALQIDPALAEAHACRGCVRGLYDWSWEDAERDFQKAIALSPSYATAHHWYAINLLVPLGRFGHAREHLHSALELDPLSLAIRTTLGITAYFAGQYDDAVRELTKTIELDDRFAVAHQFLGATYTELGHYVAAREQLETAMQLSGRTPENVAALGYLLGRCGDHDAARDQLRELQRLAEQRYVSPARFAQVHAGLNEREEALARLHMAHVNRAADLAWAGVRPVFAQLKTEPRFVSMLTSMNCGTAPDAGGRTAENG